jgi:hypothetical protein
MRCHCGSNKFIPLGVQPAVKKRDNSFTKDLYLINCVNCGTTISCTKHYYRVIEYLYEHSRMEEPADQSYKFA